MTEAMQLSRGQTLGIIGMTQKDWPLLVAAKELGLTVNVYVDHSQPGLTKLADLTTVGNYREREKLTEFGQNCDLIIYGNTAVAPVAIRFLSQYAQVPQGDAALEIVRDRLMERAFLDEINVNVAPSVTVLSLDDVYQSIDSIGYPAVLRPLQRGGGDRSLKINHQADIARAADFIQGGAYLLESWIDRVTDYSLMVATNGTKVTAWPLIELTGDADERLREVRTPTNVSDEMATEMHRIATAVAEKLAYRGLVTLHFYATGTGALYVRDFDLTAPLATAIYGVATGVSPAAQLLRVVGHLPMQPTPLLQPTVMLPLYQEQLTAVARQEVLKDNWRYRFFPDVSATNSEAVQGLAWITGGPEGLITDLVNQVADTEILDGHPAAPAPEPEAE